MQTAGNDASDKPFAAQRAATVVLQNVSAEICVEKAAR